MRCPPRLALRLAPLAAFASLGPTFAACDDAIPAPAVHTSPIVDGRRASASEVYATVSIIDEAGESNCTGTLIAPRVVVTAAHCLAIEDEQSGAVTGVASPDSVRVVWGVVDVSDADTSNTYSVSNVIVHEGYPNDSAPVDEASGAGRYDDLGLLLLDRAVSGATPAIVPSLADAIAALDGGATVTITGYGATSPDTDATGLLYIANVSFQLRTDFEIVLGTSGEPDTCPGDSGGPAYLLGGTPKLVGTTSRANQNATRNCGEGGVYGFVPAYRSWIVQHAGGLYTGDGTVDPTDPTDPTDPEDPIDPEDELDDEDYTEDCSGGSATLAGLIALAGLDTLRRKTRRST